MQNEKSYVLKSNGGKISAALAKLCAVGGLGESLVRNGVSQDAFCLFLARVAVSRIEAGKTAEQLTEIFLLLSGGNSSAARQALGRCSIRFEDDPEVSPKHPEYLVETYWERAGGGKAAPSLAALDL